MRKANVNYLFKQNTMMIQSSNDSLFTSIFSHSSQCPSLLIKFLLVLESEQLIPLFDIEGKNKISSFVSNYTGQIIPVLEIIKQSIGHIEPVLFFGSDFELSLGQKIGNKKLEIERYQSFFILTLQGLIIENKDFITCQNPNSEPYQFMSWDYWTNISMDFNNDLPLCSLILWAKEGYYLEIETAINFESEVETIEKQLPLIFCYLILKRFWRYIEKFSQDNFLIFNTQDFLYLDSEKLAYFIENILSLINIKEKDLDSLIRSIDA